MPNRLFLIFLLSFPILAAGQGLNGGFEKIHANGNPAGWAKTETSAAALTSDAFSGDKAAKAWVYDYYQPGGWVSITNRFPQSGTSEADGLPTSLTGVYKYEGRKAECQDALVEVIATRGRGGNVDTIAVGRTELKLSKKYRTFELQVERIANASDAEFLAVRVEARGRCDWVRNKNCCFLFADDLEFDEQYIAGMAVREDAPQTTASESEETESEPVFIQPMRKKRKSLFRRHVLKPAKRSKPKRVKKKKRQRKERKQKSVPPPPPPAEEAPTPIPPEIQKEIDRINAIQQNPTPDPAKAAEESEQTDESEKAAEEENEENDGADEEWGDEFDESEDDDDSDDWDDDDNDGQ